MNFVSVNFWVIFTLFMAARLVILWSFNLIGKSLTKSSKQDFDRSYLLLTSVFLFALEDLTSFSIFVGISVLIFSSMAFARRLPSERRKLFCLCICIMAVLPLLFFKYGPLLDIGVAKALTFDELLIPIGLSFYTFQLISLFVDDIQDHEESVFKQYKLLDLANYASFFPQIVAGPIERGKSLLPQMRDFSFSVKKSDFVLGLKFIVIGAFYKLVIADGISQATPWIFGEVSHPVLIHLGNFAFGIRIYGDFCGYSFMALGIAQIFGVSLTLNFRSPYTQRNIQHFWRSWHISLTNWFRDYIYIPLGGNKCLWAVPVVFGLSGIWHGAGWGFLIWGLIHGAGVTFIIITKGYFKLPALLSWAVTVFFVSISWLPFYQWESDILYKKASSMVSVTSYFSSPIPELYSLIPQKADQLYLLVTLLMGVIVLVIEAISRLRSQMSPKDATGYLWTLKPGIQYSMFTMIIIFSPTLNNGFVYFNF